MPPSADPALPATAGPSRPLDLLWLAVLGTAAAFGRVTLSRIRSTIDAAAAGLWRPTPWLLAEAIDEMIRGGHLRPCCHAEGAAFTLTGRGRETLGLLLSVPAAPSGTVQGWLEDGLKRRLAVAAPAAA